MSRKKRAPVHTSIQHVMQFFSYKQHPQPQKNIAQNYAALAVETAQIGNNQETTVALRKLLEARDAALRASLVAQLTEKELEELAKGKK